MSRGWLNYALLALLALLLGPGAAMIVPSAGEALASHTLATEALASLAASAALYLTLGLLGRRSREAPEFNSSAPGPRWTKHARRALWLLLLPQALQRVAASQLLPQLPRSPISPGDAAALALAAPLWLALLAGLQRTRAEVPRATVAAAIFGLGALLLILPTDQFVLKIAQLPMFLLALSLAVVTVFAWSYAAEHLRPICPASIAARFLLIRGVLDGLLSLVIERTSFHEVVWKDALEPMLLYGLLAGASIPLWFVLLRRLPLSSFALHPLAIWTGSVIAGIAVFGPDNWRMDAAALLGLGALMLGVPALPRAEEPIALELG